jgi:hypothetical protein
MGNAFAQLNVCSHDPFQALYAASTNSFSPAASTGKLAVARTRPAENPSKRRFMASFRRGNVAIFRENARLREGLKKARL